MYQSTASRLTTRQYDGQSSIGTSIQRKTAGRESPNKDEQQKQAKLLEKLRDLIVLFDKQVESGFDPSIIQLQQDGELNLLHHSLENTQEEARQKIENLKHDYESDMSSTIMGALAIAGLMSIIVNNLVLNESCFGE